MLAEHRYWLGRSGFRRAALWISDDGPEFIGVDWAAASEFADGTAASSSELAMLRIAVGLGGQRLHESLGDLLTGLDRANVAIVLQAIARTAGWHERGLTELVTGRVGSDCGAVTDFDRAPHSDGL